MQDMVQATATHEHMRATDRILTLKLMEGKDPVSSTGLVDRRLFTGDNKLHAVIDPTSGLWNLRYEQGKLPKAFECTFTSFKKLLSFATDYYARRNIEIKEVID